MDEAGWYLEVMKPFEWEAALTEAARIVPACPAWNAHDLVAHQVHQLSSASDGSFPVQDSVDAMVAVEVSERQAARSRQDQWTAEGVRARRETPVVALIAEWRRLAAQAPAASRSALFPDVAVHLFDLLGAGGSSAYRDHAFVVPALRFLGIFWSILAIADCPVSIVTGILAFTQHGALAGAWATVAGTLWWYILCLTAEFLTARIKGERPGSPQ